MVDSISSISPVSAASPVLGVRLASSTAQGALNAVPAVSAVQGNDYSREEQAEINELKATDREVRAHEQAHMAVGGQLVTRGATYGYVTGPDGQRYAVSGEVQIDTREVQDDPQATISKASQVKRAALAPAEPSAQDRQVAAAATTMQVNAQMELARQAYQKTSSSFSSGSALAINS